jgi:hypothetical protein
MHGERSVERRGNPAESLRQTEKESCFGANKDDVDPKDPAMNVRQTARIVERPCRRDDLFGKPRSNAAPAVENAFDRRGADAGKTGDILESRLGNGGLGCERD